MTADDRRAAILDATVPLLRERGTNITTREIAAAAGVAEGTLFRVFPDKEALVRAALGHALDPKPLLVELRALDPDLELRAALERAVELMMRRGRDVVALISASYETIGRIHHGAHHAGAPDAETSPGRGRPGPFGSHHPVSLIADGIAELLVRHGGTEQLRRSPTVCARMLVTIVLAGTRPTGSPDVEPLTAREIVELFLDGALAPPSPLSGTEVEPAPPASAAPRVLVPAHRSSGSEEPC